MDTYTNISVLEKIQDNIQKVIIGKNDKIILLLTVLLAKGHVLLEDILRTGFEKCDTASDIAERIYHTYNEDVDVITQVYQKARYSNEEITMEDVKKGLS